MRIPWIPREMLMGPILDESIRPGPIKSRYALLINPFYAKDPYSSFGKHVLTPSISLTSVAASTPEHWEVRYWDENLGQGPPPWEPFPEVVGITVHLTFAKRAYELAGWYRRRGAKVILGGLHVTSCPDEAVDYGDAIAIGEGVQLWPQILGDIERGALQGVYRGSYKRPYGEEPIPRREILPRESFLTTSSVIASRGCHNRCSFCYLATNGLHMPYQVRDVEQIVEEIRRENQPYTVFIDNNLGSRSDYLRNLCSELRRLEIIWSAAVTLDITDDPTLVREMALAGCTGV
ncbi:MAG: B12-binding domain-containing radical SAM protein, partial [Planctomycetota bacterium]